MRVYQCLSKTEGRGVLWKVGGDEVRSKEDHRSSHRVVVGQQEFVGVDLPDRAG